MKAIAMLMICACACGGARGGGTSPPRLPDKPDVPVAPIVELSQLQGSIDKVAVEGAGDMLTNEIIQLFLDQKGTAIDRDAIRDRLGQVMRMPGVWSATVKGVQLDGRIKLMIVVEPAPVVRKVTLIEWGKERSLEGSDMPKPPLGLLLDPARIEQLVSSQRIRLQDMRDILVSWKQVAVAGGVEVIIDIAHDEIKSP